MKYEALPVTPKVITWARERAGYSLEEAAAHIADIGAWEVGKSSPSYPQLEVLADRFKCPIAVFFFPEPPPTDPINRSFRTLPDAEFDQLPRRLKALMRSARVMQLNLIELNEGRNPAKRLITRDLDFAKVDGFEAMVELVRDYLGVTTVEQRAWTSSEEALEAWRQAIAEAGVFVFKDAFKDDDFSGFCLYDDEFPIVYVNNSTSKNRQIFTLFHELAHLLFHTSGIDKFNDDYIDRLPRNDQRIETICNRFAGFFLVPEREFEVAFAGLKATEESAEALADQFKVSREVIYRKFLDRGLITQAVYDRDTRKWVEQALAGKGGGGGNYFYNQISYLGRSYVRLALSKYYSQKFDDVKLAEFLNIKPKNVAKFEEVFVRIAA